MDEMFLFRPWFSQIGQNYSGCERFDKRGEDGVGSDSKEMRPSICVGEGPLLGTQYSPDRQQGECHVTDASLRTTRGFGQGSYDQSVDEILVI